MTTAFLQQVEANGVVGAGGAGFPTHVKLAGTAEVVILNAAECEPLLHKDKELLRAFGQEVLAGLELARQAVGASEAVVGIKGKYADVIAALTPLLPADTRIVELTDSYPSGDEFILVYDVTGRIIPPGKLPLAVGAVVINVETALNLARPGPVTAKFLTVAGTVHEPVTVEVPVGMSFAEVIALAGGPNVADPVALVGGAMMGRFCDDFAEPVTKTTGGLIVLDRSHPLIHRYTRPWKAIKSIGASACDQCTFCTYFCPRYLLGHPIEPHKAMRSLGFNLAGESNVIGTLYCCECNLCSMMACPEDLDPKNVCTQNKRRLMADGVKWEAPAYEPRPKLHLDDRRTPISRLIRKLGLAQFRNEGPLRPGLAETRRVVLPLKQHVGAPAVATVNVGDQVTVGQVVARPEGGALGSVIAASIAGRITQVDPTINIEA